MIHKDNAGSFTQKISQYQALRRSQLSPSSRMETFSDDAQQPTTSRVDGLTYPQLVNLQRMYPDLYAIWRDDPALFREIFID